VKEDPMLSFIKDWVLNIVTLVLFIVIIEMLVPKGRMKKYVNLVTGIILIIAIINPFLKLLGGSARLDEAQTANSNFLDKVEIKNDSSLLKEEQMKQIVEVYRKKLISQLESAALNTEGVSEAKADVIINEDYKSDLFGEVKRVYLKVGSAEKGSAKSVAKIENIERIDVGNDVGNDVKKATGTQKNAVVAEPDTALTKRLEDKISGLYGIDKENIVISLLKR
jgi:stage III sporulation protein AF